MSAQTTSMDTATQLVGKLSDDSIVKLEKDTTTYTKGSSSPRTRSLKAVLDGGTYSSQHGTDTGPESTSEEDYDSLEHDPLAVVSGGRGGGYGKIDELKTTKAYEELRTPGSSPNTTRRKSIPVKLNKLEEKGQYLLTADDAALTEILKIGLEREKNSGSTKTRQKLRDLVFTRQFTTFDRQNVESADSPFHGFFTLFW